MTAPALVRDDKVASLIYNLLLKYSRLDNNRYLGRMWRHAWETASHKFSRPVSTNIHGQRAIVNFGHTYPLYARRFRHWNDPLIELVYQIHCSANAPITVIDVGAGVGDTVLLLERNCQRMVGEYVCVEGDEEFCSYLRANLDGVASTRIFREMLSDAERLIPSLVRTHGGTASAQGTTQVHSTTLDALIGTLDLGDKCVLKTDLDGFDGKALLGSRHVLAEKQPAVIFEWHPGLCRSAGNSSLEPFDVLREQGYRRFIWFTKYGRFSHFMHEVDHRSVRQLAELCWRGQHADDWHYDVVALTYDHSISDLALAELAFAKKRRSWY